MKMTFAEPSDVSDISGRPSFDANGLVCLGEVRGLPEGIRPSAAVPAADGSYFLYGQVNYPDNSWRMYRARTFDARIFTDVEMVHENGPLAPNGKTWLGWDAMAQRKSDGRFFLFKWSRGGDGRGFAMWPFTSGDGNTWQCCADDETKVLRGHDSNHVFWSSKLAKFINCQIMAIPVVKPFPDNLGHKRRDMALFTSEDGINWSPLAACSGQGGEGEIKLFSPDGDDPEDLEFYRMFAFEHDGRHVGMQLNYAITPGIGNTHFRKEKYRRPKLETGHAPMLNGEWWLSDDGLEWRRPFRHVFASGQSDDIILHEPFRVGHDLCWTNGKKVYGLPGGRIFCIRSLSNAAFTTRSFRAPEKPVALNARFGFDGDDPARGMRGQGSIMVEVLGEDGRVVEGFERRECVIYDLETESRKVEYRAQGGALLLWQDRPLSLLAGRTVSLRFYFRDARIYDLRW